MCCTSAMLLALACGTRQLTASGTEGSEGSSSGTATGPGTDSEGSESSSAESDDDPLYIPMPDIVRIIPCDPFAQDCPEGQKCVPYSSSGNSNIDDNKCVPVLGDLPAGASCVSDGLGPATDNCDAMSFCWQLQEIDGELVGTCTALCQGTADAPECPPDTSCDISSEGSSGLCIGTCDPLEQGCGPGLACYWAINDFNCIFTTEDIPIGEPCGFINDCAPGLACLTAELVPGCGGSACCSAFCDLELGDQPCVDALPGTGCVAFFEMDMAPPGHETLGVCIVPP